MPQTVLKCDIICLVYNMKDMDHSFEEDFRRCYRGIK